jgi:hypothetical protein
MKKVKQSKKRWAWTEAQKRKSRNSYHHWPKSAPSWYCKEYDNREKTFAKNQLHKVLRGYHPDDLSLWKRYSHRYSATWMWW